MVETPRTIRRGADRPPDDRASANPLTLIFALVAAIGTAITAGAAYLVVRGPFFGGPTLDPMLLLGALGGFIVGIVLLSWGGAKAAGVGARV
jgi:hypothetical protein